MNKDIKFKLRMLASSTFTKIEYLAKKDLFMTKRTQAVVDYIYKQVNKKWYSDDNALKYYCQGIYTIVIDENFGRKLEYDLLAKVQIILFAVKYKVYSKRKFLRKCKYLEIGILTAPYIEHLINLIYEDEL